jgi:hypothetical protein
MDIRIFLYGNVARPQPVSGENATRGAGLASETLATGARDYRNL